MVSLVRSIISLASDFGLPANFEDCSLTPKQRETHVYIFTTNVTDAQVLKNQVINILSADEIFIVLDQIHNKILQWTTSENIITPWRKDPLV